MVSSKNVKDLEGVKDSINSLFDEAQHTSKIIRALEIDYVYER